MINLFIDDEEELPLNLSTKNRQIWSPGSTCERERDYGSDSPMLKWEPRDEADTPLELVKRCRSSPDAERSSSISPRRCPSEPAHQTYPHPPPPQTDINFSLLIKNENRTEKSFQVPIFTYQTHYRNLLLTDSDILRLVHANCTVSVQNGLK